jgi:putative ABC transport system permease protein
LATAHALDQFKKLGTNLISLYISDGDLSQSSPDATEFQLSNLPALQQSSKQIQLIAPYTQGFQPSYFGDTNLNAQIVGTIEPFETIAKVELASGRFISYFDHRSFFCVVGAKLAEKIKEKNGVDPLGGQIRLGQQMFTVVGVLKLWPENLFISADLNNSVIIPLRTSYFLDKNTKIQNILIRLVKNPDLDTVKKQIQLTMTSIVPNKKIIFNSPEQIIDIIGKQKQTYTWLLGAIGSISLIVGGIGVMNIMLVSVVERRREIGIRMAVGALQSDILRMFLIESIMLTVFGGFLGVVFGVLSSYILAVFTGWKFYFYATPVFLGFFVSVLVGMFSGFYPALRASKLNPIQCLTGD